MDTSLIRRFADIQLQALRQIVDEANAEIAYLENIVGEPSSDAVQLPTEGTYTAELTSAIYEMLIEGRPLHRKTILDRVVEAGIHVSGQDKLRTLSAHLSHDQRFVPATRGEWTLAHPPAQEQLVSQVVPVEDKQMDSAIAVAIEESDQMWRNQHSSPAA